MTVTALKYEIYSKFIAFSSAFLFIIRALCVFGQTLVMTLYHKSIKDVFPFQMWAIAGVCKKTEIGKGFCVIFGHASIGGEPEVAFVVFYDSCYLKAT